jgi:hypothetical protein
LSDSRTTSGGVGLDRVPLGDEQLDDRHVGEVADVRHEDVERRAHRSTLLRSVSTLARCAVNRAAAARR